MATILFIDTCADEGFIGLAEDDVWIGQKTLSDARRFGEILHTETELLVQEAGKSWGELDAVAVVSGPGSYTGLRVGMAAAKGWCFALGVPLLTLNRLELLLWQWRETNPVSGKVAMLLPARAGEWFGIVGEENGEILIPSRHFTEAAFTELMEQENLKHIVLAGKTTHLPEEWEKVYWTSEQIEVEYLPTYIRSFWMEGDFANVSTAKPEYLKDVYIASSVKAK